MAIIVENGTGMPTANSFISLADAITYAALHGLTTFADAGDDEQQNIWLIRAAHYLRDEEMFPYRGTRLTLTQRLPFPRVGAVERGAAEAYASNVVPWRMADAQVELAELLAQGIDLMPVLPRGGAIRRKTIGPLTTEWFDGAPATSTFRSMIGLLRPLLHGDPLADAVPTLTQHRGATPFLSNEFTDQVNPVVDE